MKALMMNLLLLMLMGCMAQQNRVERWEKVRNEVAEAVSKRQLRIDVRSMNTLRYGSRMVTSDFFLELRGDTLCSYLPYMGQMHIAPITSPPIGLNFEVPVIRVGETRKKKSIQLDVDARTQEDFYHYVIDVSDTGEAQIRVQSRNRDYISYDGIVSP